MHFRESFGQLRKLETLDLSGNVISAVEDSALDGLPGLKTLHLSSNSLSALPSDLFKGSSDLREIHLQNNSLSGLAADLGRNSVDNVLHPRIRRRTTSKSCSG